MATKETKDDAPVDNRDALEVLESEAKEWEKVRRRSCGSRYVMFWFTKLLFY